MAEVIYGKVPRPVAIIWRYTALCLMLAVSCSPERPPLLRDVPGTGGSENVCPSGRDRSPVAVSPLLDQRLTHDFPPGSQEEHLVTTLTEQGFKIDSVSPCNDDRSIREAEFYDARGASSIFARVFWKIDRSHRIVWTKGFVENSGL